MALLLGVLHGGALGVHHERHVTHHDRRRTLLLLPACGGIGSDSQAPCHYTLELQSVCVQG